MFSKLYKKILSQSIIHKSTCIGLYNNSNLNKYHTTHKYDVKYGSAYSWHPNNIHFVEKLARPERKINAKLFIYRVPTCDDLF